MSIDNYSLPALSTDFKECTQNRFVFIREYFAKLEELNEKVAISFGNTQKKTAILLSTTFFANLDPHTAIYLQTHKIFTYEQVKHELLLLKEIIIAEAKETTSHPINASNETSQKVNKYETSRN